MQRKIIQISAGRYTYKGYEHWEESPCLFALCNDGTLWQFRQGEWKHLVEIPQPEKPVNEPSQERPRPHELPTPLFSYEKREGFFDFIRRKMRREAKREGHFFNETKAQDLGPRPNFPPI